VSVPGYGSGPVPPGVTAGPEAVRSGPLAGRRPASYSQRALAAMIDFGLKAVLAVVVLVWVGSVSGIGFLGGDETSGIVALIVALLLGLAGFAAASLLYEPLYMAVSDGRTVGKQITGCRVVRAGGGRMTFGYALVREVLVKALLIGVAGNAVCGGLPLASLVDNLWPLWDDERRALHDHIVDSRVVAD
jgi:uncharacterized RDD family membrane protein YckC